MNKIIEEMTKQGYNLHLYTTYTDKIRCFAYFCKPSMQVVPPVHYKCANTIKKAIRLAAEAVC